MTCMKKLTSLFIGAAAAFAACRALALSIDLPEPSIYWPKDYDTNRAEQVVSVLRSPQFKYLNGLTSYWEPEFSTTLVYAGDAKALSAFIGKLNRIKGLTVQLTFSKNLSRETGSALRAGSWWVIYRHTAPNTISIRVNLAADAWGADKLELTLPKCIQSE